MTSVRMSPNEALATLFTDEGKRNPYPCYEALRELGPVIPLGPNLTVVTGHAESAAVLRDRNFLVTDAAEHRLTGMITHSSWNCFTKIVMFSNEPDHSRLREFFREPYSPRNVGKTRALVESQAERLCDELAERAPRPIDLVEEFTFRLAAAVTGDLLGIPEPDQPALRGPILAATTAFEPIFDPAELAEGDLAMDELLTHVARLVHRSRSCPRDDLTSALVRERDSLGLISEEELHAGLVMLLISGAQTPSDLLGNAIRLALDHRGQEAEPGFVTEVLRHDPPIHALTRVVDREGEIAGITVRPGSRVFVLLAAANRDHRRFAAANEFNPSREHNQPLAFGLGAHHCLGAALATMQTEVALGVVLRRFPRMRRTGEYGYRGQLVQRGLTRLDVKLS
ncbi:cytochrome P450 [Lentzea sp. NPDC004782]|uniref:cytochrome P450 n=1 Tax=Lentzea sp. NPDC004782 TaxID=3154458 RepID=UPI0033A15846